MSALNEPLRIAFVEERDGVEQAIAFCKQLIKMYRVALKRKGKDGRSGFARQPMYRKQFVESMLIARKYIREKGKS